MRVAFVDFIAVLALRYNPIEYILIKIGWTVAVQLIEVTSCRRVRLCLFCQFYEHSTYLTSDAAKGWFVKFVAGWNFSSDSSVWRGRCLGSDLSVRLRLRYAWNMRTSVGRQSGCATTTTTTTTTRVLTLSTVSAYACSRSVFCCRCGSSIFSPASGRNLEWLGSTHSAWPHTQVCPLLIDIVWIVMLYACMVSFAVLFSEIFTHSQMWFVLSDFRLQ